MGSQNDQVFGPDYTNPLDINVLKIIDQDEKSFSKYIMENNSISFHIDNKNEEANAIFVNHDFSKTKMKCNSIFLETIMNDFQNRLRTNSTRESQGKQENNEQQDNSKDKIDEIIIKSKAFEIIDVDLTKLGEGPKKIREKIPNICQKRIYKNKMKYI